MWQNQYHFIFWISVKQQSLFVQFYARFVALALQMLFSIKKTSNSFLSTHVIYWRFIIYKGTAWKKNVQVTHALRQLLCCKILYIFRLTPLNWIFPFKGFFVTLLVVCLLVTEAMSLPPSKYFTYFYIYIV